MTRGGDREEIKKGKETDDVSMSKLALLEILSSFIAPPSAWNSVVVELPREWYGRLQDSFAADTTQCPAGSQFRPPTTTHTENAVTSTAAHCSATAVEVFVWPRLTAWPHHDLQFSIRHSNFCLQFSYFICFSS